MGIYVKDSGVWKDSVPYPKDAGEWGEAEQGWIKDGGIWKQFYQADVTPPPVPQLTLELVEGRYIKVHMKAADVDPGDLDRVRVLVGNGAFPANQFSSGFVTTPDAVLFNEPWSEYIYYPSAGHHSPTTNYTKPYPPNPTASTALPGGAFQYFAAWSKDRRGNWSAGSFQKIWVGVRAPNDPTPVKVIKTQTWNADWSQVFMQNGQLRWNNSSIYMGLWDSFQGWQYGIIGFPHESIVAATKNATIKKVELYMHAQKAYNTQTGFIGRRRYHNASAPQPTIGAISRFGVFQAETWKAGDGKWIDLTPEGTAGWKAGTTRGISFEPANGDRSYSGIFDGNTQTNPPKLRITYEV
jgi:hypothetical protein